MDPLKLFIVCFFISLAGSIAMGGWWFLMMQFRETWLRWTNAEAAFLHRIGLPSSLVEGYKRLEQSRGFSTGVAVLGLLFVLLALTNAVFYFHFKDRLH